MKAICEGRSTRNDVVQQSLEQYRAVFTRTQQQINVLKAVSCLRDSGAVLVYTVCGGRVLSLPYRLSESTFSTMPITAEAYSTRRAGCGHTCWQFLPRFAVRCSSSCLSIYNVPPPHIINRRACIQTTEGEIGSWLLYLHAAPHRIEANRDAQPVHLMRDVGRERNIADSTANHSYIPLEHRNVWPLACE